jgi:prepilin-type N-terminal cleavage/methylation domain-containing protein
MRVKQKLSNRGFTIVELMIALSVLSIILVMATTLLIQIGRLYTKGVNAASLQNASRNLVANLSSTIQFNGEAPANCIDNTPVTTCHGYSDVTDPTKTNPKDYNGTRIYAYCTGTTRYSYVLDRKLGHDQFSGVYTPHVLWRDAMRSKDSCLPLDISSEAVKADDHSVEAVNSPSQGYEMLGNHMRLTRFKLVPQDPATKEVYDIQVWMAFGDGDLVNIDTSGNPATAGSVTCNGGPGTQFCSTSKINTSVARRLKNN